jgi:VanZ family protein
MTYPLKQRQPKAESRSEQTRSTQPDPTVWLYRFAPLVWMGLIFWFSHQPQLPDLPDNLADLIVKKLAQATAYAILLSLWWAALKSTRLSDGRRLVVALMVTVLYAASDEWHQTFVPNRHGQVADVLIDMVGALIAVMIIRRRGR